MKRTATVVGALLLAGGLVSGQTMDTLARKVQEAQVALVRAEPSSSEQELRDLQDELAYLRVKTRRNEAVTAQERRDLGERLDRFTARLTDSSFHGLGGPRSTDARDRPNARIVDDGRSDRALPSGTELDVRLRQRLSSKDAAVEDRVEATTVIDLYRGDDVLVPAGSLFVGHVTSVERATRTDRKGSLTVEFSRLTVNGRTLDVRAVVTEALESDGMKGEAAKIGAGAGVGAIIGGILGGVKGAIAGVLIGGGGVLVATEGKDLDLPAGSVLRLRLEQPVLLSNLRN